MNSLLTTLFASSAVLLAACSGASTDSASGASDLSGDTAAVQSAACTSTTELPGTYTLIYNAGQPLPTGIALEGQIVIEKGEDENPDNIPYPNIAVQTKFPVDKSYSASGFLWADIASFNLGANVDTGAGIGTGALASSERSFVWNTTEDIAGLAAEGLAGGTLVKGTITLDNECVAEYVGTSVRSDFPGGGPPTAADYVTTTYRLQRN